MALNTGNLSAYLDNDVAKIMRLGQKYREDNAMFDKIVNVKTTKKLVEREMDMEGLGVLSEWPERSERPEFDINEGWRQSYTQFQHAAACTFSKPVVYFSREDLVEQSIEELMDAEANTYETIAASYLENGDGTPPGTPPIVQVTCGDGVALFNASHLWRSSGVTFGNLNSASLSLTETSINTISTAIRRWKNSADIPMNAEAAQLVIPPDLYMAAIKATESRLEPDTANNAVNTTGKNLTNTSPLMNRFLSDTGDWYVLTSLKDCRVCFYFGWRGNVTRENSINKRNGDFYVAIDSSLATGVNNPMGYYKAA